MKKLRKRILQMLVGYLMVLGMGLLSANTAEAAVQGFWEYTEYSDGTVTITNYTGAESTVNIPSKINGKKVTVLSYKAFKGNKYIQKVKIPSTVKKVDNGCFENCTGLISVTGFEYVTEAGNSVFNGCEKLQSIKLSNNLKEIDFWFFQNCKSLKSIQIPGSVKRIGSDAFRNCDSLTTVTIPESVVTLFDYAFAECDNLRTVHLNMTGDDMWSSAFEKCNSLENVIIGDKVTRIGSSCFSNCNNLKSIVIPKNVREIGYVAFKNSKSLQSVTLNYGLLEIGMDAFKGCEALKQIVIPNSVVKVYKAFSGCTSLESITIPNSVVSDSPFYSYSGIINCYPGSVTESWAETWKSEDKYDALYTINRLQPTPSTKFSFKEKAIKLPKGYMTQLGYTITPSNTTDAIVWESSASSVVEVNGIGEVTAKKEGSATIIATTTSGKRATINVIVYNAIDLSDTTISSVSTKTYTGKAIKPKVTITYDGKKLKQGTDYTISYKNNKNIGTATMTIQGKGKYIGTKTINFLIKPKKAKLNKLTTSNKKAVLTWSKQNSVTGYEVYMSKSEQGTYKKIKTITNNKTTKYTTGVLANNNVYYFKIRAYKSVNGEKIYGDYSSFRSISRGKVTVKTAKLYSATVQSQKAVLSWMRQDSVSGYEIYMAKSQNSGYKKIKTVKECATTQYTTGILATGTTYYFKVRAYKNVAGKKVYGSYSNIMSVKRLW